MSDQEKLSEGEENKKSNNQSLEKNSSQQDQVETGKNKPEETPPPSPQEKTNPTSGKQEETTKDAQKETDLPLTDTSDNASKNVAVLENIDSGKNSSEEAASENDPVKNEIPSQMTTSENTDQDKADPSEEDDKIKEPEKETPEVAEPSEEKEKEKINISTQEEEQNEEDEISSSDDEEKDDEEENGGDKDYHSMTQKQLIAELKNLVANNKVQDIKKKVDEIKTEFHAQFEEEINEKKEEFLAQGGNIIDFNYTSDLKGDFNSVYFEYKEKRNHYYKTLKNDLQTNLKNRLELIEQLKGLISIEENINTTYKHFKEIQQKWREAGPIPRDGYNTVWNTYHHHVENFYDFLHLNREFRDMDFKHNLEQKLLIINRAEELGSEANLNKAFRELQMLHKMWKEDTGPVAKEYRDEVWDKFSAATKVIHDKRQSYQQELEKDFEGNLEKKREIVDKITELAENTKDSHQNWQNGIKKLDSLRQEFFATGKVPSKNNEDIWTAFKDAVRNYNKKKNQFYKNQKKEQYTNLENKKELIRLAEEHKDSDDFDTVTPLMKQIQNDWKNIGHVPRKDSDKIWKKFKAACNHYFDRLNKERNADKQVELEALEKKKVLLDEIEKLEMTGNSKDDLNNIKTSIAAWKEIGRVPFNKKNIDSKFHKVIDQLFKKLDMSKKEVELIKYDNKLEAISSHDDERKMQNERFFITKKIEEVRQEINQLENNLGFFQHVDDDNPLVKEVHKNIQRHKDELELWKAKLKKLKEVM